MTEHITISRELLRQVLDALKHCIPDKKYGDDYLEQEFAELNALRVELRAALEQPVQEPVAWIWKDGTVTTDPDRADGTWTPLYTAPQAQQPAPCSDHPDAPHGFDRNRSHSLGRYVCDCEGWTP